MQHQQKLVQLSLKLLGQLPDTTVSPHLQESLASAVLAFITALYAPKAPQIPGSQVSLLGMKVRTSEYLLPTLWRQFVRCMQNVQCLCMQQQSQYSL